MLTKKRKIYERFLVLVVVAVMLIGFIPFGAFAYNTNGTFSDLVPFSEFFGVSTCNNIDLYTAKNDYLAEYDDNNQDENAIFTQGVNASNYRSIASNWSSILLLDTLGIYKTATFMNGNDSEVIDLSSETWHFIVGSDSWAHIFYIHPKTEGSGFKCAVVQNSGDCWVVGSDDFYIWEQDIDLNDSYSTAGTWDSEVYQADNGFYVCPSSVWSGYEMLFSDMSIYNSTPSGDSGFTSWTLQNTDFSFDNIESYYDFNTPKKNGEFVDPNVGSEEPSNTFARYYLNFHDTTSYTGNSYNFIYHNHSFNFNEYQLNYPQEFEIGFEYIVYFHANYFGGTRVYKYTYPSKAKLSYFLGQCKRLGTGSKLAVPLNFDNFICTADGAKLTDDLKVISNRVTNTFLQYCSPDDLIDKNSFEYLEDKLNGTAGGGSFGGSGSLGSGSRSFGGYAIGNFPVIQHAVDKIKASYLSAIVQFKIVGYTTLYDVNDSNFHSFSYHDYHDFLNGDEGALDTNNTIQPYEKPEALNDAQIVDTSGGGSSVSGGSNNVTVTVNGATGSGAQLVKVWTPFTLDEVDYANTKGMFSDILEFMNAESENGFIPVVKKVFSYIPEVIWTYITISIAVICGFAVVRFVLRR